MQRFYSNRSLTLIVSYGANAAMPLDKPQEARPSASAENVIWDPIALLKEGRELDKMKGLAEKPKPLSFDQKISKAIEGTPLPVRERIESLIDGLSSDDKDAQSKARSELKDYGKAAIPFLLRDLGDDTYAKREAVGQILASMRDVAVPGLLSALNSKDLEVSKRATKLLDDISENVSVMKDHEGRLRRLYDPESKELLVSADYRNDGVLNEAVTWGRTFRLQSDGKYIRSNLPDEKWDKVTVAEDGTVRFTQGRSATEWTPDGTVLSYWDGRLINGLRKDGTPIPPRREWPLRKGESWEPPYLKDRIGKDDK